MLGEASVHCCDERVNMGTRAFEARTDATVRPACHLREQSALDGSTELEKDVIIVSLTL